MLWRSIATSGSAFSYLFQNKYMPALTNCVFGYKQFALIYFSITAQHQKAKEDERSGSGGPKTMTGPRSLGPPAALPSAVITVTSQT